jgi:hypothetical protein
MKKKPAVPPEQLVEMVFGRFVPDSLRDDSNVRKASI